MRVGGCREGSWNLLSQVGWASSHCGHDSVEGGNRERRVVWYVPLLVSGGTCSSRSWSCGALLARLGQGVCVRGRLRRGEGQWKQGRRRSGRDKRGPGREQREQGGGRGETDCRSWLKHRSRLAACLAGVVVGHCRGGAGWGGRRGRGSSSAAGCYGPGCSSPTCLWQCRRGEGEGEDLGEEAWWRERVQ